MRLKVFGLMFICSSLCAQNSDSDWEIIYSSYAAADVGNCHDITYSISEIHISASGIKQYGISYKKIKLSNPPKPKLIGTISPQKEPAKSVIRLILENGFHHYSKSGSYSFDSYLMDDCSSFDENIEIRNGELKASLNFQSGYHPLPNDSAMKLYRLAKMDTSCKTYSFDDRYEISLKTEGENFVVKREADSIFIYRDNTRIQSVSWEYWHSLRRYMSYFNHNNVLDSLESYQSNACELKLTINAATKTYYFSSGKPRPQNFTDFLYYLKQAGLQSISRCE
ncbi:hypothetical protein K1X84_13340 [bacterium]|nr:hypothetical protein [bacterium]